MLEIKKGRLHFLVDYAGACALLKPGCDAKCCSLKLLFLIRNNIALLANYHIKHSDAKYKKGDLKQYFAKIGWAIILHKSQLTTDELGRMWVV